MSDPREPQEPIRDPELAALLRAAEPDPRDEAVDWDALHAAILDRAALPLARARAAAASAGTARDVPAAGHAAPSIDAGVVRLPRAARRAPWWPRVVPLAAAAALLVTVGLELRDDVAPAPDAPAVATAATVRFLTAEEALAAEVSDAEFRDWIDGAADAEALLWLAAAE